MSTSREAQAVLCPLGDGRVAIVHRTADRTIIERLGGVALDLAVEGAAASSRSPNPIGARLFSTTPEVERLLTEGITHEAKLAPGHFLPVVLDENLKYSRQVPLREVDTDLLTSASNSALLATAVAAKAILHRLAILEELIREVGADVRELTDRWDSRQRAQLRSALMDLADISGLSEISNVDWGVVRGHRDTLMTLHGEILEEMRRLASKATGHRSPTISWSSTRPEDAERISMLLWLEVLIIQGLDRWTEIYVRHRPLDTDTDDARERAIARVSITRREAAEAASGLANIPAPDKISVGTVALKGPIRARRQLTMAKRNQAVATSHAAEIVQALAVEENPPPLQIAGLPLSVPAPGSV